MLSLYKYMPMSTLLKFMEDPCMRITPCHCQNDPYEFGFSKKDVEELNDLDPKRNVGTHIKDFAQRHGLISLSSDYKDICMWAHYADNHKGAVVEILVDPSYPFASFCFPNFVIRREISDLLFNRVNYVNERSLKTAIGLTPKQIRSHYYFTKYVSWSSESEYRFIVPFDAVNKIICTKSAVEKLKKKTSDRCNLFFDSYCKGQKTYELQSHQVDALTMDPESFEVLENLWNLSTGTDVMFFSRLVSGCPGIASGSIGRIYFGLNSDLSSFMKAMENRSPDSIYGRYISLFDGSLHSLFQATVEEDSFELKFSEILRHPVLTCF